MVEFDRSRRKESSSNLEKNNDTSYGQTWRFSPPFEPCMIYWEVITATKDRNAYFNNFKFVSNVNVVNMRFGSSGNQRERERRRGNRASQNCFVLLAVFVVVLVSSGPTENSVLWNAMINPLLSTTLYVALWY